MRSPRTFWKKSVVLDALQQRDAVGLPRHLGVGNLVAIVGFLIEARDAVSDQRLWWPGLSPPCRPTA